MGSVLVLGGARSGKSSYAESLATRFSTVTYIATGIKHDNDADWQERIALHQSRRPSQWHLIETVDLPSAIGSLTGIGLIDCLTLWLTSVLDGLEAWTKPRSSWGPILDENIEALLTSVKGHDLIIVSNEIGFGVHPETASGRLFRDELGRLNAQVAAICEEVVLVIAGIPMKLKGKS
ncbi:bifunctional adenosylcobalamin biosynthesis protein CobP [mine drainage metagenome]|uniref:Adenosylcobinamide kinase n=1 Tax=mine drainage metagenome TaxID=410659 RepID=A0A1J5P8Z3_9ZZZZ